MTKLNTFEEHKTSQISMLKGGGQKTGGGTHSRGFKYDSDYTSWEPGATEWTVNYYGIETCVCK